MPSDLPTRERFGSGPGFLPALSAAPRPRARRRGDLDFRGRPGDPPIGAQISLLTRDLDADWQRAVAAGATVLKAPEPKPWGQTVGYLRDLNGSIVELQTASPRG